MDSKRLKAELVLKGMSVTEFAKYLGMSSTTLYRKMTGKSMFTLAEVAKARKMFGNRVADAIFFEE